MLEFICNKESVNEISKKFIEYVAEAMKNNEITSSAGDYYDKELNGKLQKLIKFKDDGFIFDEGGFLEEPYGYVYEFFEAFLVLLKELKKDYTDIGIEGYVHMDDFGSETCLLRQGVRATAEMDEIEFFDQLQCVNCHKWVDISDAHLVLNEDEFEFDEDYDDVIDPLSYGESGAAYCICSEECKEEVSDKIRK